jgi:mannitol-1-phosphate 5-dehydrogenase
MNAVIYGAGNIGRGFIGLLFAHAGYNVTFIDMAETIVNALNEKGAYPVRLLSNDETEDIWVKGVSAIHGANEQGVIDCIAGADIMATAVGVRILPLITPLIASALKKRFQLKSAPLNIIVCENLIDADKYLAELISKNLNPAEIKLFKENIGLVEASIGRMIPIQVPEMQDGNILRICSEKYAFLPVNKEAFKGPIPEIKGMVPFSNFDFFIQRKIFIHNMGHAVCAYLGLILGDTYISQTIARGDILFIVQNAMLESAAALQKKFNIPLSEITDHIRDLICRFGNPALKDTCVRVGADIERKLSPSDRLIAAMRCCVDHDIVPAFISIGAAAALYCLLKERNVEQIEHNASMALERVSALNKDSEESRLILEMYQKIRRGNKLEKIIQAALLLGKKPDVI